jgi:hypothetical protein
MKVSTFLSAAALAAVIVSAPAANAAAVVKVLGAGSSAMWQTAATGAWNQLAGGPAAGAQWFTIKGTCTGTNNCAQIADSRNASIVPQSGNLWVVWNSKQTEVWAYISVDSVLGNRSFFAVPRTTLQLDPLLETGPLNTANENLIVPALFQGQAQAALLPSAIYTALNNASITTAFTDIRPEDAHFANCRVMNQLNTSNYNGLGYGTGTTCTTQVGTNILSAFSTAYAQPVNFNVTGTDPITHQAVKAYSTIDVGATPVVYIVNRTNVNGLGFGLTESGGVVTGGLPAVTDIELASLQKLFSGAEADTNLFGVPGLANSPINVVQREPMSGTMNTHEFTDIRCGGGVTVGPCIEGTVIGQSQEKGVNPGASNQTCPPVASTPTPGTCDNPLNLQATTGGWRYRAIGTGELVGTGVHNITDSVGYTFFGYGNVSKLTNSTLNAPYGYLTLTGVDPIQSVYTNGELPYCTSSLGAGICPASPGSTFPNVRNGSYRAWSMLRVVTDAVSVNRTNYTNTLNLVSAIQNNVNTTTPDFVPYKAVGSDPGMTYYRSHFKETQQLGTTNNGLCGAKEIGGDMGGYIVEVPNCPAPAVTTACPPGNQTNSQSCHQ